MGKKLYEEESVRAIANAIREKGVSGNFKIGEMPNAIKSIQGGGGGGDIAIPLDVKYNGEYVPDDGYAYKPVKVNVPNTIYSGGTHCNEYGKFVYPVEEWGQEYNGVFYDNNIENIEIPDTEETIYVLCEANYQQAFCRFRIGGGSAYVWYGLVKDGEFTPISARTSVASGGYYGLWLEDFDFDHFVIKMTQQTSSQHISYMQTYAWASDGIHTALLSAGYNSCLMRYGNMPYGTTATCTCYSLEVDNIKNFAAKKTNTTVAISYSSCYALQKLRIDGWNIAGNNLTTMASMFNGCYVLSDVPDPLDLSGWVTNKTTSLSSVFSACYSMKTRLLVYDWDLSAVTTAASLFSNARSIYAIEGTETWTGGENITTIGSMFNATWNIRGHINLSGLTLTSKLVTASSVFSTAYCISEISLPNIDFTNVTAASAFFYYCTSLRKINHGTIIPCTSKMTTVNNFFAYCNSLRESDILKNWDLTNANMYGLFSYCTSLVDSRDFCIDTIIPSTLSASSSSSSSSLYYYCANAQYLDYSMVDLSKDSASTKYSQTYAYNVLYNLREVIPHKQFLDVAFTVVSLKLSRESLIRIMEALPTTTASRKLTMGAQNLAKLSDTEKAIATGKGWTLA